MTGVGQILSDERATERLLGLYLKVEALYGAKLESRSDWADSLYVNHVVVATRFAADLAARFGADAELCQASALLHDIADYKMKRHDPQHKKESLRIARELMYEFGYSNDEVRVVVDDAIRNHSCQNGRFPQTLEGRILATADSLAHLKTDFYLFATWELGKQRSLEEIKQWVLSKIERDLFQKISFDSIRDEARCDYEAIRAVFGR